jgi:uncharacterized membrane protein SirB2
VHNVWNPYSHVTNYSSADITNNLRKTKLVLDTMMLFLSQLCICVLVHLLPFTPQGKYIFTRIRVQISMYSLCKSLIKVNFYAVRLCANQNCHEHFCKAL